MISLVVPHRGSVVGLWSTIFSSLDQLQTLQTDYEVVVVSNGEPVSPELSANLSGLVHVHSDDPLSPPRARALGAKKSSGDIIFFFDNHCVPAAGYFRRAVHYLRDNDVHMMHSAYQFTVTSGPFYHYNLKLDYNFWGEGSQYPVEDLRPYKIGVGGHGGFAVKRSAWDIVGGYGPDSLLVGYGGEEVLFDFTMWLYGLPVHIDPRMLHYHFAGNRGYTRHYTDDYYVNMLVCAHVVGGEKWLYKLFDSFVTKGHIRMGQTRPLYDLLETAYERSRDYANEVRSRQVCDLDELLCMFRREQVAY
jgi:hypothetical protein